MLSKSFLFNILLTLCAATVVYQLFSYPWFKQKRWSVIVTPLASIIGSGFLVVAPLLHNIANGYASLAILGIVSFAYLIGAVLRHNILHVEPLLAKWRRHKLLRTNEQLANLALSLAYLVSVAFYLRLMASFLLEGINLGGDIAKNSLTTVFLAVILGTGLTRGLDGLEVLEKIAVNVKLGIISALIAGLLVYDIFWLRTGAEELVFELPTGYWQGLRQLAGALLIVQGFETCRYLGDKYDADMRVNAMKPGQLVTAVIYLVFVIMAIPAMSGFEHGTSETAIIDISAKVAYVLPFMLVIAAAMSQASASIADTLGAGGLVEEATGGWVTPKMAYVALSVIAMILVWTVHIFQIISLASRLFAFYYAIQCFSALLVVPGSKETFSRKALKMFAFGLLGIILILITIFALPVSHT